MGRAKIPIHELEQAVRSRGIRITLNRWQISELVTRVYWRKDGKFVAIGWRVTSDAAYKNQGHIFDLVFLDSEL